MPTPEIEQSGKIPTCGAAWAIWERNGLRNPGPSDDAFPVAEALLALEEKAASARAAALDEAIAIAENWSVEIPDQESFDGSGVYMTIDGSEIAAEIAALKGKTE